jgi:hypothetical protein
VALGWPAADPVIGLVITVAILGVLRSAIRQVGARLMDAVDPSLVDQATAAVMSVHGVQEVRELRIRWIGHTLRAEVDANVDPGLTVTRAHDIAHHAETHLLDVRTSDHASHHQILRQDGPVRPPREKPTAWLRTYRHLEGTARRFGDGISGHLGANPGDVDLGPRSAIRRNPAIGSAPFYNPDRAKDHLFIQKGRARTRRVFDLLRSV